MPPGWLNILLTIHPGWSESEKPSRPGSYLRPVWVGPEFFHLLGEFSNHVCESWAFSSGYPLQPEPLALDPKIF